MAKNPILIPILDWRRFLYVPSPLLLRIESYKDAEGGVCFGGVIRSVGFKEGHIRVSLCSKGFFLISKSKYRRIIYILGPIASMGLVYSKP